MSIEDEKYMKIAENSVKIVDEHYNLRWPFRRDNVWRPDNGHVAE